MPSPSTINAPETRVFDPLLYTTPLPYTVRCYPFGFPADIASDSPRVLEAARVSWSAFAPRFARPPVTVHVMVSDENGALPPAPVLRGQRHLVMWVADRANFSVLDRRQRFAYACVTRATVADQVFFRWHFLDALVYMLLELNYLTSLHGACVAWKDAGLLLYGPSGMGKSTLSYACARRGWTYISDDSSSVLWDDDRTVLGEPHHFRFRADAPDLFPELRGLTVGYSLDRKPTIEVLTAGLPIRTAPECRVHWIVFLDRCPSGPSRLLPIGAEDARERIEQDMPVFDPDLEPRRRHIVESIAGLPAFVLQYSHFEDAVPPLEKLAQEGDAA